MTNAVDMSQVQDSFQLAAEVSAAIDALETEFIIMPQTAKDLRRKLEAIMTTFVNIETEGVDDTIRDVVARCRSDRRRSDRRRLGGDASSGDVDKDFMSDNKHEIHTLEQAVRWLEINNVTVGFGDGYYRIEEWPLECEGQNLIEVTEVYRKAYIEHLEKKIGALDKAIDIAKRRN